MSGNRSEWNRMVQSITRQFKEAEMENNKELVTTDMLALMALDRNNNPADYYEHDQRIVNGLDAIGAGRDWAEKCAQYREYYAVHFSHSTIVYGWKSGVFPKSVTANDRAGLVSDLLMKWAKRCGVVEHEYNIDSAKLHNQFQLKKDGQGQQQDKVQQKPVLALPAPIEYHGVLKSDSSNNPMFVPLNQRKSMKDVRYASFGSSSTWGAKLPHRNKQTYVKVLSEENGENYAIRATGPNYPAACAKSILQDEVYDVFILEFFDTARTGLLDFTVRLRERFPDALIILLVGQKFPWYHCGDHSLEESKAFARGEFGLNHCHKDEYKNFMRDHFREHKCENNLRYGPVWQSHYAYMEMIASETNSFILEQSKMELTGEEYLAEFDRSKADDCFHMGVNDHAEVAQSIQKLVERVGVPKQPVVRDFHATDHCLNWFLTGDIDSSLKYSPSGGVVNIPNTEKFALQFRRDGKSQHWIEMRNESDEPMYLFVSHMTTGPYPTNVKYPKASAHYDGQKIDLNPIASTWKNLDQNIHVTTLTKIGRVAPGDVARVHFVIKEESEWPFRIVQVLFTPKGNYGDQYLGVKESMIVGEVEGETVKRGQLKKKDLRQG